MKIGLQTISWGLRIQVLEEVIQIAKKHEYHGLELAQKVGTLPPAASLLSLLEEHQMAFIGLSGGSLRDRIAYTRPSSLEYLYIDEWDDQAILDALEKGFKVGVHPHYHKRIATIEKAEALIMGLEEIWRSNRSDPYPHERIGLILDTAHLYLTGDQPNFLPYLRENKERVFAVHLKDWTERYGRTPANYARGFLAPGKGELKEFLDETVGVLRETGYKGWIIVEQDSPEISAEESARESREWLRSHEL